MNRPSIEERYAAAEPRRALVAELDTGAPVIAEVKLTALEQLERRRGGAEVVEAGTLGKYVRPWLGKDTVDWHVLEFRVAGYRTPLHAPAHLSHFRPA